MIVGRTLQQHFSIESRQHDILGWDLGEGPPRRTLVFGMIFIPAWCLLMYGLLSLLLPEPITRETATLYIVPPGLVVLFGMRPSERLERRRAITDWILGLRYPLLSHQPIIRLGARKATRAELLPLRVRWALLSVIKRKVAPAAEMPIWARNDVDTATNGADAHPVQAPINLRHEARVIGSNALYTLLSTPRRRGFRRMKG